MNNIQDYLKALNEQSFSDQKIAEILKDDYGVDCVQSTINRIRNGKTERTNFSIGIAISQLYNKTI